MGVLYVNQDIWCDGDSPVCKSTSESVNLTWEHCSKVFYIRLLVGGHIRTKDGDSFPSDIWITLDPLELFAVLYCTHFVFITKATLPLLGCSREKEIQCWEIIWNLNEYFGLLGYVSWFNGGSWPVRKRRLYPCSTDQSTNYWSIAFSIDITKHNSERVHQKNCHARTGHPWEMGSLYCVRGCITFITLSLSWRTKPEVLQ